MAVSLVLHEIAHRAPLVTRKSLRECPRARNGILERTRELALLPLADPIFAETHDAKSGGTTEHARGPIDCVEDAGLRGANRYTHAIEAKTHRAQEDDEQAHERDEDRDALLEAGDLGLERGEVGIALVQRDDFHGTPANPRANGRRRDREFPRDPERTTVNDGVADAVVVAAACRSGSGHGDREGTPRGACAIALPRLGQVDGGSGP
jgi:hypothetical protein